MAQFFCSFSIICTSTVHVVNSVHVIVSCFFSITELYSQVGGGGGWFNALWLRHVAIKTGLTVALQAKIKI